MWIGQVRALGDRCHVGGPGRNGAIRRSAGTRRIPALSFPLGPSSLEEGLQSSLGAAKNQRMHIMGTLIGVDRFEIQHVPHDTELV
jgi:hypothetical protein